MPFSFQEQGLLTQAPTQNVNDAGKKISGESIVIGN